jgi:hypothetical protein
MYSIWYGIGLIAALWAVNIAAYLHMRRCDSCSPNTV